MLRLASTLPLTDRVGERHYVLQLCSVSDQGNIFVASLSTGGFRLVQLGESGIRFLSNGAVCTGVEQITDIGASPLLGDPNVFQTSSTDGFVRSWDLRVRNSVESYSSQFSKPIYSCSSNSTHVAGGVGEDLVLWDRRTRKTAATFGETHAMDIVQTHFNPSYSSALISGSEDGNISVFDLSGGIHEEDSFVGALAIGTSVSRMGFFGPDLSNLWSTTGTESIHWWNWKENCDPNSPVGAGVTAEALTPREVLTFGQDPSDYIIKCFYDAAEDSMFAISGNISGSLVIYSCHAAGGNIIFGAQPTQVLTGGHNDIVRDVLVLPNGHMQHSSSTVVLSGGEDGKLCLWTNGGAGERSGKNKHHHGKPYSPY
ncbi:hypothetical protein M9434_000592 [Picochlorum sp. BPE23]|nr:hypothetical protein M9434_000592 [Picochlorum sp. BPE23]